MHCGQFAVRRLARPHTFTRPFSSSPSLYAKASFAGPTTPELVRTSYHRMIGDQVQKYPHKDLLRSAKEDLRYTYNDVMYMQDALASGILESSIPKDASFATALPMRIEAVISQLATARSYSNWAVLPPLSPASELEKQLKAVKPHTLIWPPKVHQKVQLDEIYQLFPAFAPPIFPEVSEEVRESVEKGTFSGLTPEQAEQSGIKILPPGSGIPSKKFPSLCQILHTSTRQILPGMHLFMDFPVWEVSDDLAAIEPFVFPYVKKTWLLDGDEIVALSQFTFINTGYLVGQQIDLNEEDVVLTTLMPHSSSGLSLGLGMVLTHTAKLVYASELFSVEDVLPAITKEYCSVLVIEPKNLTTLLDAVKPGQDFSKLKKLVVVTTPGDLASQGLIERAKSLFGIDTILVTFGTQTTGGVISTKKAFEGEKNVGTALPHTQVTIVDEKGVVVEKGVEGLLKVEGYLLIVGEVVNM